MTEDSSITQKKVTTNAAETRQGVVLNIQSGLLEGSERFLDNPSFTIGSDTTADIILLDDGIAPTHAMFSISRSLLGVTIAIRALADGVVVNDVPLGIEETTHSQQEIQFTLAGIKLNICDSKGYTYQLQGSEDHLVENSVESESNKSVKPTALAISAVVCFSLSALLFTYSFEQNSPDDNTPVNIEIQSDEGRDKFLLQLKQKIKDSDLDNLLEAKKKGLNGIEVSGRLQKSSENKWLTVLKWYDAQSNPPMLFNQVNRVSEKNSLPNIRYAWFGDSPYIVLQNNQKLDVGEVTKSGWKVDTIDDKGIMLSQSENRILLKFE